MTSYRWLLLVLLGVGFWSSPAPVQAATTCSADLVEVNFLQVDPSGYSDIRARIDYRCETWLSGRAVTQVAMCFSAGVGSYGNSINDRRMRNEHGDEMAFQIYRDPARTYVWGMNASALVLPAETFPVFWGLYGILEESVDVYARVPTQPDVAAGSYASQLDGLMTYRYQEGGTDSSSLRCNGGSGGAGQDPIPFPVSAQVPASCKVLTTTALDFTGAAPLTGTRTGSLDATAAINLECRNRTAWKIGLDEGLHHDGSRRMSNGSQYIRYELRQSPSGPIWGNVPDGNVLPGTGTGQSQTQQVHGRVPDQPLTGAGTYSDTVKVTVTY